MTFRRPSSVIVTFLLLTAGCTSLKELKNTLSELLTLQQGLTREFGVSQIEVKRSDAGVLTVTLVNAPLASQPDPARAKAARQVAEYVRDHFPSYGHLTSVIVAFKTVSGVPGITISTTDAPYQWSVSDLGPPALRADSISYPDTGGRKP